MDIRKRNLVPDNSLLGSSADWTTLTSGPGNTNNFLGFSNGDECWLKFRLFRTNSNETLIGISWSNVVSHAILAISYDDTNATSFNYDGLAFRLSGSGLTATNITFKEVHVDLNPVPVVVVTTNIFYSATDNGPGFFSGDENLVIYTNSGKTIYCWSTSTPAGSSVTNWTFEGWLVELPDHGNPGKSTYGITVTPSKSPIY